MNILLLDFDSFIEKMIGFFARIWISILYVPKFLPRGQTLGAKSAKSAKKYCHVGTLEAFYLWSLSNSMKAKRLDS